MCGIAGLISDSQINPEWLYAMNSTLRHRGPDDEGYVLFTENGAVCLGGNDTPATAYTSGSDYQPLHGVPASETLHAKVALAHRRLAIVDLSTLGHQPLSYLKRYWLVFNGEIYNHAELREELQRQGYAFLSNTDTEVILAAFDFWGYDCMSRFNGMWSFALFDSKTRKLLLSRDRFGVKPLYYWISPNGFLAFASEIKAFTVLPGWTAVGNSQRIYDYLLYSFLDHTDETLFKGVYQILPGFLACVSTSDFEPETLSPGGKLPTDPWYSLTATQHSGDDSKGFGAFRQLLSDSVRLRLKADVPVGSCLSGGLDSSSIVCLVNKLLCEKGEPQLQRTYSACSAIDSYDERRYIDIVVNKLGVNASYTYPDVKKLLELLPDLIWHQDEPFGSTSIFAQWCVFELAAKDGTKVMLDGQGADEMLIGYHSFFGPYLAGLARRMRLFELVSEWNAIRRIHGYSFVTLLKWIVGYNLPAQLRNIMHLIANKHTLSCLKLSDIGLLPNMPITQNISAHNTLSELSYAQITSTNLQKLLHWEDRNSMAHSVEARVPFLDYRLVEYVLGLSDGLKTKKGVTKIILREAMRGMLPEKVRLRYDKLAFATPEELWFKGAAADSFRTLLQESLAQNSDINVPNTLKFFDDIVACKIPYSSSIWRLLCYGAWCRRFDVSV